MKNYQVILTKAYEITVNAMDMAQAKHLTEFYTSNIRDISTVKERKESGFSIEKIECRMNEAFEVREISN